MNWKSGAGANAMISPIDAYDFWPRLGRTILYVVTSAIVVPVGIVALLVRLG